MNAALSDGAAGCLCSRVPEALLPGKFYIQVQDTTLALGALAAWYRGLYDIPVVQVTGSAGKTTTKEMLASVLSRHFCTLKTRANLNNHIGTPQTLLELEPRHQAAVIETGLDHFGQIRYMGSLVQPTIAVITNVGRHAAGHSPGQVRDIRPSAARWAGRSVRRRPPAQRPDPAL